ncbi:uncharacterized protein [Miscanthus floridulus]|uniref:uncharacterized protein n=1 Tax=Miscanthus floridulus TaxID=154761 RepID=UPI00345B2E1C
MRPHSGSSPATTTSDDHAKMMAEMLATRRESARALEMLAQAIGGFARGGPDGNGGNGGCAYAATGPYSYQDFLKTHPPPFTPTVEPLDAEHWLCILEQKFQLLTLTEEQKVCFAAQQLLGSASAWWDTFNAMQPVNHRVTWHEFTTALREYYIPASLLNRKLTEFLDLKQGSMTMMDYVNKFNHLAQYTGTHVDTDEKKMDHFYHGLSYILQNELYTGGYQTFGALMNVAIAMEGLQCDSQAEWKRKQVTTGSSSHAQA